MPKKHSEERVKLQEKDQTKCCGVEKLHGNGGGTRNLESRGRNWEFIRDEGFSKRKGKKPGMHGRKQNVLVCLECLKWQEIRREK